MTTFKEMTARLAKRPGVRDPAALSAYIARRKYGDRQVQQAAAAGRSLSGAKPISPQRRKQLERFVDRGGRRG